MRLLHALRVDLAQALQQVIALRGRNLYDVRGQLDRRIERLLPALQSDQEFAAREKPGVGRQAVLVADPSSICAPEDLP